jgi:hypothetical protein
MITIGRFALAFAGAALMLPFAGVAAPAQQPALPPSTVQEGTAAPNGDSAKPKPAADKTRACRSVRADPSSRRKTKVCRTVEEWRKLNVPL